MKTSIFCLPIVMLTLLAGCGNGNDSVQQANDSNQSKMDSPTTQSKISLNISEADAKFMTSVANDGMTEVALGKLAVEKSSNQKIKDFGNMMIKDHSAAGDDLKKIAVSKKVTLPDSLSESSKKDLDNLRKKKGKDFDKAYINEMVSGHEKVLKEFQDIQTNGSDSDLKVFVTQTIPIISHHLESAKTIKDEIK
ncbi:MAG TPA: DUF4142 domain-containing protein [Puia sp.]|nr:DUF4142 domain-containing protein [Puia sp.]